MPKRPQVSAPKFGKWLESLRAERSFEQIAQRIRPLVTGSGLKVDRSLVKKLEQGRVPSWPLIGALAQVYGVSITATLARLSASVEFPGARRLFSPATHAESSGSDVERIALLERRVRHYERSFDRTRALGTQMLAIMMSPERTDDDAAASRPRIGAQTETISTFVNRLQRLSDDDFKAMDAMLTQLEETRPKSPASAVGKKP